MIGALYALGARALGPAVRVFLVLRRALGKEDTERMAERLGHAGRPRPEGPLIWLHGASVGEALSALPLIERLLAANDECSVLMTSGTVTSARLMEKRLPARAFHQYVPVDLPRAVGRFLGHWRPDLALWLESELWPNMIRAAARRDVEMVLINGRLSARSFARWRRAPGFARSLLGAFKRCLAQSDADAERLAALGARDVVCLGNLKFASAPLPADSDALEELRARLGARPLWLAASTHPGEEAIVAEAHRILRARHPALLTVIAPRHPGRGPAIATELASAGLQVVRRAADETPEASTDIYLADTLGELGLFYRLAPIALVGGSLVPHGGQNLLEPAQLDCAILHGPAVFNFEAIAAAMQAAGASEMVRDAESLANAVEALLVDGEMRARRAKAAAEVAASEAGVLDRVMEALAPHLALLPGAEIQKPRRKEASRASA
ncbi:MAG TPA: 3-deoxy-D-manno-octulosonic acid transferase [Alphaproteobacteria bacterium]|nr:3-deoxy-D-manno-octulosonic acid transferase [Alphaproteobacteria bacterium]